MTAYNIIQNIGDMPSDMKKAYLTYLYTNESEQTEHVKAQLKMLLRPEEDDAVRAMAIQIMGASVDEEDVRKSLTEILPKISKESVNYCFIKSLMITTLSDDMDEVRAWGIRLIREYENINPENNNEMSDFLYLNLDNEKASVHLRWHCALGLAYLGTNLAIDKLLLFCKKLLLKIPVSSNSDSESIDRILAEKVAYSIGVAAEQVCAYGKSADALGLLQRIADRVGENGSVMWAINELNLKHETQVYLNQIEYPIFFKKVNKFFYNIFNSLFNLKFAATFVLICLMFVILYNPTPQYKPKENQATTESASDRSHNSDLDQITQISDKEYQNLNQYTDYTYIQISDNIGRDYDKLLINYHLTNYNDLLNHIITDQYALVYDSASETELIFYYIFSQETETFYSNINVFFDNNEDTPLNNLFEIKAMYAEAIESRHLKKKGEELLIASDKNLVGSYLLTYEDRQNISDADFNDTLFAIETPRIDDDKWLDYVLNLKIFVSLILSCLLCGILYIVQKSKQNNIRPNKRLSNYLSSFNFKTVGAVAAACLVVIVILYKPETANISIVGIRGKALPDTRGKTAAEFEVKEGGILKNGDYFSIRFVSDKDAYLYVLLHDSLGEITELFSDKVSVGKTIVIANSEDGSELMLDDTVGDETLYFLTSDMPIEDLDKKLDTLRKTNMDQIKQIFPKTSIQIFRFRHEK